MTHRAKHLLFLDPGTRCGWAIAEKGVELPGAPTPWLVVDSGVWSLKPRRHESAGMRWVKLLSSLGAIHAAAPLLAVGFEEVRRHLGTDAAHVYGGLTAHVESWGIQHDVETVAIPVATIKRRATGKGNAPKEAVFLAACERWPSLTVRSSDEADALWGLQVLIEDHGAGLLTAEKARRASTGDRMGG